MRVTIVIPTFDRAELICRAVDAALGQTHENVDVLVVDDASGDRTWGLLERYAGNARVSAIRLGTNGGTAVAKNVGFMFAHGEAVTFHDSDDVPEPEKIARQVETLSVEGMRADAMLNWAAIGRRAEEAVICDLALTGHVLHKIDGSVHRVERSICLVEDFFPNLQINSGALGDWVLINSGLFRRTLFTRLGGFAESIEEDRDMRNRIILSGGIVSFLPEPLLRKFEGADSLTVDPHTDYRSARRARDRAAVWARALARDNAALVEPVDLSRFDIEEIRSTRPLRLARDVPVTGVPHPGLEAVGMTVAEAV